MLLTSLSEPTPRVGGRLNPAGAERGDMGGDAIVDNGLGRWCIAIRTVQEQKGMAAKPEAFDVEQSLLAQLYQEEWG